jgi:hypothetical protein
MSYIVILMSFTAISPSIGYDQKLDTFNSGSVFSKLEVFLL